MLLFYTFIIGGPNLAPIFQNAKVSTFLNLFLIKGKLYICVLKTLINGSQPSEVKVDNKKRQIFNIIYFINLKNKMGVRVWVLSSTNSL